MLGDAIATGDAPRTFVISEKARVTGKVWGGHVIINGRVIGPVRCNDLRELQPRARVVGDVR